MAERTGISWCDATFNPWMGCTEVSPACDHCYAKQLVTGRMGKDLWGHGKPRHRTSASNWKKVRQWNKTPEKLIGSQWPGRKPRIFAASLADIFDNEIDPTWRDDFWQLVRETPNLHWLIVTKRVGNAAKMLPADWGVGYSNVTLIITVANQAEADRDIPKLMATPAAQRGLSIEPMLGPITLKPEADKTYQVLSQWYGPEGFDETGSQPVKTRMGNAIWKLNWVICGGESGKDARPLHPEWARTLRDECAKAEIPFHFKQWGEFCPCEHFPAGAYPLSVVLADGTHLQGERVLERGYDPGEIIVRPGVQKAGRSLDGAEHNAFPEAV